jgi:hypothetical protein
MNVGTYIEKMANSLELDTTGLIKSEQQLAQEQQQAQEQQLMQQGAEGLVDQAVQQPQQ